MLAQAKLIAFAATARTEEASQFYCETLGLPLISDEPFALVFDCAGTQLRISKRQEVTPAAFTVMGWEVEDIAAAVAGLTRKGVNFERYEGMHQDDSVIWASPGGARVAWFKDPDGNILSLTQWP